MRVLHPVSLEDVDPVECYRGDDRSHPAGDRPWLLVNMIATVDGATSVEGRSGGLGGPADRAVFGAIRSVADTILVGAATVRAESYHSPKAPPGRGQPPRLAIVTRSLDVEPTAPVFTDAPPDRRPLVVTTERSDASRRAALAAVAEVVVAGDTDVDVGRALGALHERGAQVVLCEGGPSLNGQLVAADAVDELCLSLAPLVAGGRSARVAHGDAPARPAAMQLSRVLEEDGYLFLRYVRAASVSDAWVPSPS